MKYGDVPKMKANLDKVNFIENANHKFGYAVAKNKEKCEQIIKTMNKLIEPSEALTEYREKADKINTKYAEKDADGTVGYVNHPTFGRSYRKLIGEGNPTSEYSKAMAALDLEYDAAIKEHKAKVKIYTEHLEEEVSGDDNRWRMIDESLIPDGLNPAGHDGCLPFIKEEEEPVKEEPVKPVPAPKK